MQISCSFCFTLSSMAYSSVCLLSIDCCHIGAYMMRIISVYLPVRLTVLSLPYWLYWISKRGIRAGSAPWCLKGSAPFRKAINRILKLIAYPYSQRLIKAICRLLKMMKPWQTPWNEEAYRGGPEDFAFSYTVCISAIFPSIHPKTAWCCLYCSIRHHWTEAVPFAWETVVKENIG